MKWNIEWVDLQNIEHMVAECWRMNDHQLEKYVQRLSRQQELVFAGELGVKFLDLLRGSIDNGKSLDWAKLQKDIHLMQELIQDGVVQHDVYWKSQYQELTADTGAYFGTEFGRAFTEQLAAKLDLGISEEQRMLQNDIGKIQKICLTCNWDDEEKARKALMLLTQEEKYYFSSWLGDAFINVLQERYGKKEAEAESGLEIQLETAAVKKSSRSVKAGWIVFLCISAVLIGLFMYMQSNGAQGREKLMHLLSEAGAVLHWQTAGDEAASPGRTEPEEMPVLVMDDGKAEDDSALPSDVIVQSGALQTDTAGQAAERMPEDDTAGQAAEQRAGSHALDRNTADTGTDSSQKAAKLPDILPQYQSFHEKYPDLFGWLKIPGTIIDHPVMQSDDEQRGEKYYYLHRDYTGQPSEAGSLFVEEASSCFPQDDNTVIYGHNMSNGYNFGMLEDYKDPDFFREHPVIQYDTIYETGTYQIVAVLITRILYQEEEGFRYYRFYHYDSQQEFQECVDFMQDNQLYDTGEELQYGDQLLMLSTCEYSKPNGRLVVAAKRIG